MPLRHDLDTASLLAGYRSGAFTPRDYMDVMLAYVEACEPKVGALWGYEPDQARAEADRSTARWRAGAPVGSLDGVPVTVKELIATKGMRVPMGTAASESAAATEDSPIAARLREAGAIIFARTTVPDYGMLSSGLSSFHTLARNPWDLATNPGGSSAGAASAAAAGYGPLHVGTDIGGSVRLPAAWCGLVGFKPTLGRIPIDPYYTGRCAGPMTRTVDDAARMMSVLSLPDSRDATSVRYEPIDWHAPGEGVAGLRIGLMMEAGCGMALDDEIASAVRDAARVFEQAGATVVDVGPVLNRAMLDGIDDFWRARFWGDMQALSDERRSRILPYILQWAQGGADVNGVAAVKGFNQTFAMRAACAACFDGVDVVLSPTTPNLSFPATWASPVNDPARPFEHIAYTLPWNMGEQPAFSINCGFSRGGTPIGLQIVTRRFEDLQAMQLAFWYEQQRGPITNWPTIAETAA
ncbi:amidase [Ameyamaea chiangmaiensis NBRC 103196]|uniref:Amidase n=1 Tax=Ameyamaea chiangmaiensis TaxID=442969 RepID=A0A850PAR4_9PROT|nr:amidase [Ameyamaea chiangmaiensis]MBS4076637.1 amidase [Ameyamaea chiangmaiensis]NVN41645.1 amidase [Ameyamaea chiangmaiensis]GBQ65876.1 amidase [Ameyamaea chiangmaiensis NBRC 103196]